MCMCNFGNCLEILDGTDLIIGSHNGDNGSLVRNDRFELLKVNMTLGIYVQIGDRIALLFERLTGIEYGMMLDFGGDDVLAAARRSPLYIAADGKVVCL